MEWLSSDVLDAQFLGNPLSQWLIAVSIALGLLIALVAASKLVSRSLRKASEPSGSRWTAALSRIVGNTRLLSLLVVSVAFGAHWLDLPPLALSVLRHAAVITALVQVGSWGNALIPMLVAIYERIDVPDPRSRAMTATALKFFARLLLWTLILIFGLENLGIQVSALVASLGVGGIAVAFAAQNFLGDIFASLAIIVDRPFVIGDYIIVDELEGNVEKVALRTTHVRSLGGEMLVFSNNDLLSSRVRNFQRMRERRVEITLQLVYGTPFEKLSRLPQVLEEVVGEVEGVRFDRAHFNDFGDSSLDVEVVYWVTSRRYRDYMDARQGVNFAISRRFEEESIEFAYPTQTIYTTQS